MSLQKFARSNMLSARIRLKWIRDRSQLPLTEAHRELHKKIHRAYYRTLGTFPDLVKGRSLNEKIQWLKLFDQSAEVLLCSDKIHVRNHVLDKIGSKYLVDLYQVADSFAEIDFAKLPSAFALKANHDSGTVVLVRDKGAVDVVALKARFDESLRREAHGWHQGEWNYKYISRKIFAEELLDPENPTPPPDYKFHCSSGKVSFVHYLYDRGFDTKEQTLTPDGADLGVRLSQHYNAGQEFRKPRNWDEMTYVAERLSEDFKYVRVDLYFSRDRIYVGEMTFFPYAGSYRGDGQRQLGELINFDRSTVKPLYRPAPMDA